MLVSPENLKCRRYIPPAKDLADIPSTALGESQVSGSTCSVWLPLTWRLGRVDHRASRPPQAVRSFEGIRLDGLRIRRGKSLNSQRGL